MKSPVVPRRNHYEENKERSRTFCGVLWGKEGQFWSETRAPWNAAIPVNGYLGKFTPHTISSHETEAEIVATTQLPRSLLALADKRGALFLIDIKRNAYTRLQGPDKRVTRLQFSNYETNCLMIGRTDGSLQRYNVKTRTTLGYYKGLHQDRILSIDSSSTSHHCLSCSPDTATLWNFKTTEAMIRITSKNRCFIQAKLCHHASNQFVIIDNEGDLSIRCLKSGAPIRYFSLPSIHLISHTALLEMKEEAAQMLIVSRNPSALIYVDISTESFQFLQCPDENSWDPIVDITPCRADTFLVCRQKTCLFVRVRDWRVISKLTYSHFETDSFLATKVTYEENLMTVISETGTVLLFDPREYLSKNPMSSQCLQRLEQGTLERQSDTLQEKAPVRELAGINNRRDRLHQIVLSYGKYPGKYRRSVWTTLLQIPRDHLAFRELKSRKLPSSLLKTFKDASKIHDTSRFRKLRQKCSALLNLVKWNEVFWRLAFVEDFISPFIQIFFFDEQTAFEALGTVWANWGNDLVSSYPKPPWNLLSRLSALLKYHDPDLHERLEVVNCVDVVLWELLSTGLNKVLQMSDWVLCWDHIFSSEMSFYDYLVVALIGSLAKYLTKALPGGLKSVKRALSIPARVDMEGILIRAYEMMKSTPICLRPKHKTFQPLTTEYGSYVDLFPSMQGQSEYSLTKIREIEEQIDRNKRIHKDLQEETIELENRLANKSIKLDEESCIEEAILIKDEDVLKSMFMSRKTDLNKVKDQTREEKLKHLKLMNTLLKQQTSAARLQSYKQQNDRLKQKKHKLKALEESYRSSVLDSHIDNLTRSLQKSVLLASRPEHSGFASERETTTSPTSSVETNLSCGKKSTKESLKAFIDGFTEADSITTTNHSTVVSSHEQ